MLEIVKCSECGKEVGWKRGDKTARYSLEIEKPRTDCKTCHNTEYDETNESFCSRTCLKKFVGRMSK